MCCCKVACYTQQCAIARGRFVLSIQLKNRYDQLLASSTTKEKPVLQEE